MNYHELNYITLASVSGALILSLALPEVEKSMYFHRIESENVNKYKSLSFGLDSNLNLSQNCSKKLEQSETPIVEKVTLAYKLLWMDFNGAYRNSYILKWSIWWAIATAGNLQVQSYIQALWKAVDSSNGSREYNGAVNAIQCLLCTAKIHTHQNETYP